MAGLAHLCLEQGDLAGAVTHVEEILGIWDGTAGPFGAKPALELYRDCYRVLQAAGDPRAKDVLREAYSLLQESAAKIDDDRLRRSYLENVTTNLEIAEEYKRLHQTG